MPTPNGPEAVEASFFTDYLDEVSGPFVVVVGRYEYTLAAPPPGIGELLDTDASVFDVIDELCDEPEVADELFEHFDDRPVSEAQTFVEAAVEHWGLVDPPRDGFARVAHELDRYGGAIEFDLDTMGIDMRDYVRGARTWAQFMRYLAKLPVGGHYAAALALDDELALARHNAKEQGEGRGSDTERRPSLIGWTPELAKLTDLADEMRRVTHATWGASTKFKGNGGKAPRPSPRPHTADQKVATAALKIEHDDIAGQLLGARYTRMRR